MQSQTVQLSVPAEAMYARPVRMMAANLAVVSGMDVDTVEDVRMAAEEGFVYACHTLDTMCTIEFCVADSCIEMNISLGDTSVEAEEARYACLLLKAVCDEFEIDDTTHTLHALRRTSCTQMDGS